MTPRRDVALAKHCTIGVGGPARWFVDARSEDDVCHALQWASDHHAAVHVLGGGSNLVVSDAGFDGLVLRPLVRGIEVNADGGYVVYSAGAGEPWDDFVALTVGSECAGLECLSGIPGLVGGTPIQNVGAYGQEVSETIVRVHVVDRQSGTPAQLTNSSCRFAYRTSRFKRADANRFIVTRVEFALVPGGAPKVAYADLVDYVAREGKEATLASVREATLAVRRRKGMVIEAGNPANRSCGSFFVNPVVSAEVFSALEQQCAPDPVPHFRLGETQVKIPAAWLIERAGFPRGTARGAVGVSPFQAQAIVNLGGARASDVVALAAAIKRSVWSQFAVLLVPEPVFVGFEDDNHDLQWLLSQSPPA